MRKKRAAARGLKAQGLAERSGIHGDQHEIALSAKPFGGRLFDLRAKREMDESIGEVSWSASEAARYLSFPP